MDNQVNILDTRNLHFEGDFDDQVQEILSFVRLTDETVHDMKFLFDDLEYALQYVAPGCIVEPFGSIVSGLALKTSDVDCYIALPNGEQPNANHILFSKTILIQNESKFSEVVSVPYAKVPIVKFLHVPTQRKCDFNFKSPAGVRNSKLIAFLLRWDNRVLQLAVLIKYWSKVHKLTGTNLLTIYCLILMVIFYFQLMNILPSVYELQRNVPSNFVDGWNTAFDVSMASRNIRNCTHTLYELMGGFFKFYSTFNFKEHMISPFLGFVITKKCFDNFHIPEEFSLYKEQVTKNVFKKLKTNSIICVQDPFEHSKNCGLRVSNSHSQRIISLFQFASDKFAEDRSKIFLRSIFTQDPHIIPKAPKMYVVPKHTLTYKPKLKVKQNKRVTNSLNGIIHYMYFQYRKLAKGK